MWKALLFCRADALTQEKEALHATEVACMTLNPYQQHVFSNCSVGAISWAKQPQMAHVSTFRQLPSW